MQLEEVDHRLGSTKEMPVEVEEPYEIIVALSQGENGH